MDTIFAQASAPGRAGVAVLRVSGPRAFEITEGITGIRPVGRDTRLRSLRDVNGEVIDTGLVLSFEGPNSFTGEDVVEYHLHGSTAIVRAMLSLLSTFPDTRMAEPGEFTRRALENEKLDLAQVEGLADLIEAETEAQRKQAIRVFSGHLGARVEVWRSKLIRAAALLEATIDFADEDVPVDVTPEVTDLLQVVRSEIDTEIRGTHVAERVRTGFEVAIIGAPNAGKSTLLNALAGRDAAITSEIAGTTRDVIEVRMDLGGLPVTLLDTAGLRESFDTVEAIGIERAKDRAALADLRVFLALPGENLGVEPFPGDIVLRPKVDLAPGNEPGISGKTGEGVGELIAKVQETLVGRSAHVGLATHERHRVALEQSASSLTEVDAILSTGPDSYDLAADELRVAVRALETLVGRIDVENLLDEIFTSFCIGK